MRIRERTGSVMYVSADARGTGLATSPVEVVNAWARRDGVDALFRHVTERVARAFFKKMGFRDNGARISVDRDPSLKLVTWSETLADAYQNFRVERAPSRALHELRRRVLRLNDPAVSVVDPRDEESTSLHCAGFLGDRLVVSASFYPSASPVNVELVTYQLRYMATDLDVQGMGYGAKVIEFAESELRGLGAQQVWANGRDTALGFYRATGWTIVEGSEHLSPETRLPHTVIFKIF